MWKIENKLDHVAASCIDMIYFCTMQHNKDDNSCIQVDWSSRPMVSLSFGEISPAEGSGSRSPWPKCASSPGLYLNLKICSLWFDPYYHIMILTIIIFDFLDTVCFDGSSFLKHIFHCFLQSFAFIQYLECGDSNSYSQGHCTTEVTVPLYLQQIYFWKKT